ncbi:MAG: hypothetical protein ACREPQ_09785 [Rhodanobacter sp.]
MRRLQYLHEIERAARLDAELQVDALLARVRQPEPVNFCAIEDELIPARRQSIWIGVWFVIALAIAAFAACGDLA